MTGGPVAAGIPEKGQIRARAVLRLHRFRLWRQKSVLICASRIHPDEPPVPSFPSSSSPAKKHIRWRCPSGRRTEGPPRGPLWGVGGFGPVSNADTQRAGRLRPGHSTERLLDDVSTRPFLVCDTYPPRRLSPKSRHMARISAISGLGIFMASAYLYPHEQPRRHFSPIRPDPRPEWGAGCGVAGCADRNRQRRNDGNHPAR
ncbi:hypothetical protein SAMN05519105_2027 [Rhodobacter sp. 24-YEA-8]|nr:hypothetical protein SAMN05519105_2027 [Rhodobacter sp. 24-YEA-8]